MENHTESDWLTTWYNFVIGLLKQAVFKHVRKVVYVIRYCRKKVAARGQNVTAAPVRNVSRGVSCLQSVYRTSTIPSAMSYTLYRLQSPASVGFSWLLWTPGGV